LPGEGVINDDIMVINAIALSIVLTTTSFYLERSKNLVMNIRADEVKKSRELVENMQNIALEIKRNTTTIYSSSDTLTKALLHMRNSAAEIDQTTMEASSAINQGTQTVQELASSFSLTVKRMRELEHSSLMTEERGNQATETIKQSMRAMAKINESRQEYDTILQAITDIADSAHLLSLNAAIEAAKAGEFGKGFFVVVEEIRDLAQRSNDAVIDIRKVIKKGGFVLSRSKRVIASIEEAFNTVILLVENITRLIRELTSALEEQNIGIKEIAKGTEEMAHSSEENTTLIKALRNSIEDNAKTVENLHQIAKQLEIQQTGSEISRT
jgi:methyl-accepting chemotaxis protein